MKSMMSKVMTVVLAFIGVILISVSFNSDNIVIAVIGVILIISGLVISFKHFFQSIINVVKTILNNNR